MSPYEFFSFIFVGAKIISHGLFINVQLMSDFPYTSGRELMFDLSQLFKCNIHVPKSFGSYIMIAI